MSSSVKSGLHFISLCLFSMAVVTAFQPRFKIVVPLTAAAAGDNCTNCKANMSTLGKFLASDEIAQATVDSFKRDLCPYYIAAAYEEDCEKNVTALWPAMAKGLFSSTKAQGMVCQGIKKCNATRAHRARQVLMLHSSYYIVRTKAVTD